MKIEVLCKVCKNHHFDHYECSVCGTQFNYLVRRKWGIRNKDYPPKYCAWCGEPTSNRFKLKRHRDNWKRKAEKYEDIIRRAYKINLTWGSWMVDDILLDADFLKGEK